MQGKTCCVTGHRDIPAGQVGHIKKSLEQEVDRAIRDGFTCFISGFADGVDLLFAEIVVERIAKNPSLKLIPVSEATGHAEKSRMGKSVD